MRTQRIVASLQTARDCRPGKILLLLAQPARHVARARRRNADTKNCRLAPNRPRLSTWEDSLAPGAAGSPHSSGSPAKCGHKELSLRSKPPAIDEPGRFSCSRLSRLAT